MKIKWLCNQYQNIALATILLFHTLGVQATLNRGHVIASENSMGNSVQLKSSPDSVAAQDSNIPVLYGEKKYNEITGSVSFVNGKKIQNLPGVNRMNTLTGLIPGLLIMQNDGLPGYESASLYLRGQSTFGPSGKMPLVILDGIETEITQINPYDIESITVLKDAVSTAMYGMRATNGIILVTSRKGVKGNIRININSQASIIAPNKVPAFLEGAQYAELYNEAAKNEGLSPKFSPDDIEAFRTGNNPFLKPNNNWTGDYLAKYSFQTRQSLDISGGTENARYLFAVGYVNNSGVFNTDKGLNSYNTNTSLDLSDIHTNLDFLVNDRLSVNIDLKAKFDRKNNPGLYSSDFDSKLIGNMMDTPPMAYPALNPNGSLAGTTDFMNNIYGILNKAGYSIWNRTFLLGNFDLEYKLDDLIQGLKLRSKFGFSNYVDHITNRSKSFAVYEFLVDSTYNKIGLDTEMNSSSMWSGNNRYYNAELGFQYNRTFSNSQLTSLLMVDRQEYFLRSVQLPHIYKALKGNLSYQLKSRYLFDFSFAFQGSEQFPKENRYGFFPAIGLGWVLTEESFLEGASKLDLLKLRLSAGRTGNDFNPYLSSTPYFAHIQNFQEGNGFTFGTTPSGDGGFYEAGVVNNNITWEKSAKANIGLDAAFFDNQLSLTTDYFYEKNKDILIYGANPGIFGANFWYPVGIVQNQGVEGAVTWNKKMGNFNYFFSTNASFNRNKIIDQKEPQREYDWMKRTGHPIGTRFGYVFDRFFTENDDFSQLPDQSQLGEVRPGDLKYKDLNNDMIINEKDQTKIGKSSIPELFYGITTGFKYKGIDFNFLFQGVSMVDKTYNGSFFYEFVDGKGNVSERHLGRWTPGAGQSATYPRLSIQKFSNNRRGSSFWVEDGSYLRLKTVELGYTFNEQLVQKAHLKNLRIYLSAYNLFTFSKINFTDPETTAEGSNYPIPRIISAGLNLSF